MTVAGTIGERIYQTRCKDGSHHADFINVFEGARSHAERNRDVAQYDDRMACGPHSVWFTDDNGATWDEWPETKEPS